MSPSPSSQTGRRVVRGDDEQRVQQAVDQNAIEPPIRTHLVRGNVRYHERSPVTFPRTVDVTWIDVDAEVVCVREVRGVGPGTAADVQHPPSGNAAVH